MNPRVICISNNKLALFRPLLGRMCFYLHFENMQIISLNRFCISVSHAFIRFPLAFVLQFTLRFPRHAFIFFFFSLHRSRRDLAT